MRDSDQEMLRRVLIASVNPLFARGLQNLLAGRWQDHPVEFRLVGSSAEASAALETWQPDLVVVDYDDTSAPGNISRAEFLSHFIAGNRPMQVMLVSLRASGEVVVYDRHTLTTAQAADWFELSWAAPFHENGATVPQARQSASLDALSPSLSRLRSGGMKKHFVVVGILTVVLTLITGFGLKAAGLMPVEASAQSVTVDSMISLQSWMIAFLFSLIVSFIGYSVFISRRMKDREFGAFFKGSAALEVGWTLVPLITVIFLAFLGSRDLAAVRKVDSNALEVKVTAFQWGWLFEYPDSGVQSNTLYLPVDRQVHFTLTSRDVIHSFWVPEFRLKQDVLPGKNLVKELRVTPTRIGDYKVRCAEMCGGAHAYMESPVKVVSQADFDAWIASQSKAASANPADRGATLAKNNGCTSCHSVDGSKTIGPTWKGLAGAPVKLADGSTVTADDAYLHTSIVDPNAQVVAGFPPGMMPQTYKNQLNDQQIADIIAYIKTLK